MLPEGMERPTVLVVDDNMPSLYATTRILRGAGFEVIEATSGGEALALADRAGLIVLDVNLPDMDGFDVCRQLRARTRTAYLPIVHLTATFMERADMTQGLEAGADSYLTHPADPAVLIATVKALLFARQSDVIKRAADARFRKIFELASGGIALLDAQLVYAEVNPALCVILGRDSREIVGRAFADLVSGKQREKLDELRRSLAEKGQWSGQVVIERPGGERVHVEWHLAMEADGQSCIGMASDVTIRQRLERERERLLESERSARSEAERSNQLKDEFLAVLSHELRNPLNAILGWAKVLNRTPDTTPLVKQGLEAIERNSILQSHLINDLLDVAGIRFGKMRLDMAVVSPAAAVEAALDVVASQAQRKSLQVLVELEDRDAHVLADESRVQQIVWNLLTNAIKFTPAHGTIRVAARKVERSYQIEITDTGKGIEPDFLPRLFDRFAQQEAGANKRFAGLGIGLAIVKHLVDAHKGSIEAYSEGTGKGATFRVQLPLTDEKRVVREAAKDSLAGLHVLLVEDDGDARALIARILGDSGIRVSEAASADEALAHIAQLAPDLLISDIGMAGQHGYQLIRTLRAGGYSAAQLPAIALTAFSGAEDRDAAIRAGFQVHLSKPVNADALKATIAALLHAAS
jgi:PAS domain S-box-containing protein